MDKKPLAGRVAVVTGCSRQIGIGFAIAQRLVSLGADLMLHGFRAYDATQPWGADETGLDGMVEQLRQHGQIIKPIELDFEQPDAPGQLLAEAVAQFGHVDILVANHAYSTMGNLEEVTAQQLDKHLQINVRATVLLAQAFAAQHNGRDGGRIIMLTSGQHLGPMPAELAYIASKGALHPLNTSLSAHLAPRNITVNTVNPGATDTGYASADLHAMIAAASPHNRWGQPADVAKLIGWLCTDEAEWITGQIINSNGGGL